VIYFIGCYLPIFGRNRHIFDHIFGQKRGQIPTISYFMKLAAGGIFIFYTSVCVVFMLGQN